MFKKPAAGPRQAGKAPGPGTCPKLLSNKTLGREIGPETAFYSPIGKKHRVENIGDEPLRIVWVYCPPLPAHRG